MFGVVKKTGEAIVKNTHTPAKPHQAPIVRRA